MSVPLGPWTAIERVIGASHVRSGKPCQDDIGLLSRDGEAIVALADGHGSSRHADIGARLAVSVTLRALSRFAEELGMSTVWRATAQAYAQHPLRVQLVREWTDRVRAHAGRTDVDLVDYGSTMLFALATDEYLLLGQLGDGDILLVDPTGSVSQPFPTAPGSIGDETESLSQRDAWLGMKVQVLARPAPGSLLLLATDGYSKSYRDDETFRRIGPDYLDLIRTDGFHQTVPHLRHFLTELTTKGSGDDIALGMIYWPDRSPALMAEGRAAEESGAVTETTSSSDGDAVPMKAPANERPGEAVTASDGLNHASSDTKSEQQLDDSKAIDQSD